MCEHVWCWVLAACIQCMVLRLARGLWVLEGQGCGFWRLVGGVWGVRVVGLCVGIVVYVCVRGL